MTRQASMLGGNGVWSMVWCWSRAYDEDEDDEDGDDEDGDGDDDHDDDSQDADDHDDERSNVIIYTTYIYEVRTGLHGSGMPRFC